jgi:hypothetical protein
MALQVFISYSTKDLPTVDFVKTMLVGTSVEVYVAERDLSPGTSLSPAIAAKIKTCDLFIVLWSANSRTSDWVQQEIGIAKAHGRQIIPVVLTPGYHPPAFISDLKFLDVAKNPATAFTWLRDNVVARASEKDKKDRAAILALGGALLWLFSR